MITGTFMTDSDIPWHHWYASEQILLEFWKIFCDLYEACTGGLQPLCEDFNLDKHMSLVGEKDHAVFYFTIIHNPWADGDWESEVKGNIQKKIEVFALGYIDGGDDETGLIEEERPELLELIRERREIAGGDEYDGSLDDSGNEED